MKKKKTYYPRSKIENVISKVKESGLFDNFKKYEICGSYRRGEIHDKRNKGELTFDEADRLLNDLSKSEQRISAAINSSATINDTNNEVTDFFGSYMNPYGEGLKDTTGEKIK